MHGFVLLQREKQKNGPHEQRAVFSQEQSLKAMHSLIEIRVYNVVIGLRTYTAIPIWRVVWIVRKAANFEAYCAKSNCRATCQTFLKEFWTRSISTLISARVINRLRIPPSLRGTDSFRDFLRVILPPVGFVFYIFLHFSKVVVEI